MSTRHVPARIGDLPPIGSSGRTAQLTQLDDLLTAASSGRGNLALLVGEPGIGKTRLARECARRAAERGFLVAWSACGQDEGAPGFWPWTQLVTAILAAEPGLAAALGPAARLDTVGAAVSAPVGPRKAPRSRPPPTPSGPGSHSSTRSPGSCGAAVRTAPLLLIIDDDFEAPSRSMRR